MLLSRRARGTDDTISLPASLLVADGFYFKCFQHPTAAHYCIKVMLPQHHPARFRRCVRYFKALHRRGIYLDHIAAFHGLINTSLGKGAIFEMVLDDDGRVSKSLDHYLALNDKRFNAWVIREIESLKQSLHNYWIASYDLNPTNVLVKRLGFDEFRLVVVGGIGDNQLFPLASYSRIYARKKLASAWNPGYQQWYAEYPSVLRRLKPYLVV
ncbi:MAG: YrbL family protein [Gammaproteobacteria bacterium]|nr:YrbL family protein [Gammaproteobacteria bacterium]MDH3856704.1 YrbL family protein [Gammaproteobacteria bacterium]